MEKDKLLKLKTNTVWGLETRMFNAISRRFFYPTQVKVRNSINKYTLASRTLRMTLQEFLKDDLSQP